MDSVAGLWANGPYGGSPAAKFGQRAVGYITGLFVSEDQGLSLAALALCLSSGQAILG